LKGFCHGLFTRRAAAGRAGRAGPEGKEAGSHAADAVGHPPVAQR